MVHFAGGRRGGDCTLWKFVCSAARGMIDRWVQASHECARWEGGRYRDFLHPKHQHVEGLLTFQVRSSPGNLLQAALIIVL